MPDQRTAGAATQGIIYYIIIALIYYIIINSVYEFIKSTNMIYHYCVYQGAAYLAGMKLWVTILGMIWTFGFPF